MARLQSLPSWQERRANGPRFHERMPRGAHEVIGKIERDPITILKASSAGRIAMLIPLRYGRMFTSPFAFYCGSERLQAHDLAATPITGMRMQICGDCHLSNFRRLRDAGACTHLRSERFR